MMSFWVPLLVGIIVSFSCTQFILWHISEKPTYAQRAELTADKIVFYICACGFLAAVVGFWLGFLFLQDDMYAPLTAIFGSVAGSLFGSIGPISSFYSRQKERWEDEWD